MAAQGAPDQPKTCHETCCRVETRNRLCACPKHQGVRYGIVEWYVTMARYGRPNNHRRIPNVFSKKQLLQIFEKIEEVDAFVACLITLFCGLRISEICKLKKQDVDLENEKVTIRNSKWNRDRVVMLPKSIIPLIRKWLRLNSDSEYFVADRHGQQFKIGTLSKKFRLALEAAELRIVSHKDAKGMPRHAYTFHTLRHTYATYLLEQGVDLYYVQRSLGHVDIHTTQIYAYISNKDLQNKINQAFHCKMKEKQKRADKKAVTDPLQLLQLRYANSEITLEEFEEKVNVIAKTSELGRSTFYG
jgi:integrase